MSECVKCGRLHPCGGNCGRKPKPNPDDLRTSIAKKLHALYASTDVIDSAWDDLHPMTQEKWLRDADAVIRELGLQRETVTAPLLPNHIHDTRYVTAWIGDDQ